ncbi:hypothetical protein [Micromonospora sp. DT31]|uniref:hypothetical protein n=1 Tax=Micromonospora sp. DT31 TaxID=3393434 RepID=UPI003CF5BDE3
MEREELISLLADESPVNKACRAALGAGAAFRVWDGAVPASNLAGTYRAREQITRDRGIPTLGSRLPSRRSTRWVNSRCESAG